MLGQRVPGFLELAESEDVDLLESPTPVTVVPETAKIRLGTEHDELSGAA